MSNVKEELKIAETYLTEMLEADRTEDYEGFICRFDETDLEGFDKDTFLEDTKLMRKELGLYKNRVYLGHLNGFKDNDHPHCLRFIWRGIFECNEALIILGIHKKNDIWYVNENTISK